jgi:hypothetical protein
MKEFHVDGFRVAGALRLEGNKSGLRCQSIPDILSVVAIGFNRMRP